MNVFILFPTRKEKHKPKKGKMYFMRIDMVILTVSIYSWLLMTVLSHLLATRPPQNFPTNKGQVG